MIEFGYHRVGLERLHGHRRKTVDHALSHHPHSRSSFPLSTLDETFFLCCLVGWPEGAHLAVWRAHIQVEGV